MTIKSLLEIVPHIRFTGDAASGRRSIKSFSTDSRSLKKGQAFIALVGETFDGHAYLDDVAKRGASLAIVSEKWYYGRKSFPSIPLLVVIDPLEAYGQIATAHRTTFSYPVIAIAGSNGKTTTKELVADVLATKYNVLRTEGNLNNLIGVPATMLRMSGEHTAAVIEIGTNMPGEIEKLCQILRPTHGVITNIGREHLELLGSVEGVAEEEGALFRYLESTGGTAFINLDDPHLARMAKWLGNVVTYGRVARAGVMGKIGKLDDHGAPSIEIIDRRATAKEIGAGFAVKLKTPGLHTATNALAAAAIGLALRVPPSKVRRAIASFEPREYKSGYARLASQRAANGARVLNDTYNANPDSVAAAVATLGAMKPGRKGRRIVVLADMKELGASSIAEHARVGTELATKRVDLALFFGGEMRHAHDALRGSAVESCHFDNKESLVEYLLDTLRPEDIVLVKGSRGMKMEEVVQAITKNV